MARTTNQSSDPTAPTTGTGTGSPTTATPTRSKSRKAKRKSARAGRLRRSAPTLGSPLSRHIAGGHLDDATPGALRALIVLLAERLVEADPKTPTELGALGIPAEDTHAALQIALRLNKLVLASRVRAHQVSQSERGSGR